jgi:hypothetical protein
VEYRRRRWRDRAISAQWEIEMKRGDGIEFTSVIDAADVPVARQQP